MKKPQKSIYTISNNDGLVVSFSNYGARITSVKYQKQEIARNGFISGRCANRIKGASFELNRWYLKECRENQYVRERGVMLCKLFLNNKYIEKSVKKKILNFMDEINEMIIF